MLLNKCLIRKIASISLIAVGLITLLQGVAYNTSTLFGISMLALGLSWLMKSREASYIALIIPLAIGIQGLVGLTSGLSIYSSLGIVWCSALRGLEELTR